MVGLIFLVWFKLFVDRLAHIRRNPPAKADFATGTAATRYFEPVELPAANFRNLFEMPVLYFALVPLLLVTHHGNHIQVALAWVYVALRTTHSLVHIAVRRVPLRFMVYLASCAVLSAMWIGFAIDMAAAG